MLVVQIPSEKTELKQKGTVGACETNQSQQFRPLIPKFEEATCPPTPPTLPLPTKRAPTLEHAKLKATNKTLVLFRSSLPKLNTDKSNMLRDLTPRRGRGTPKRPLRKSARWQRCLRTRQGLDEGLRKTRRS